MFKVSTFSASTLAWLALAPLHLFAEDAGAETHFTFTGNPLVRHVFTADPSARVFDERLYVYTSHDRQDTDHEAHYDMIDWRVLSTDDMVNWIDHGVIMGLDDIAWADRQAWAPDAIKRNGTYYFYYPVEQAKIGVAISPSPDGPFVDALGKPLIDKTDNEAVIGREPIDPAILIDDDGQAYMYFGCRDARVVKLQENMIALDGEVMPVVINGIEGHVEGFDGYYGEGPWIIKRNGLYYYIYANGWHSQSTIVYAIGESPLGPFDYVGPVMTAVGAGTSHGSIVHFKGKDYIFYHNIVLSGSPKQRSVCFDEIAFDADGKIIPLQYVEPNLVQGR